MTDCLLIGHNDMSFTDYAEGLYAFGKDSPAYRDLKLNFIWHKGKRHTVTDILNLYSQKNVQFSIGDVFSTTIAYLGTYLNKHGFSFDYINDYQSQKEEFKDKLLSKDIFAIGITSTLYTHLTPIEEICKFIRRYNKDVRIIVGGPFILNSFFASSNERALHVLLKRLKVDVLVNSSQGETTLVRVLQAMKSGNCLGDIPNITYWKNGVPKTNLSQQENNKLDENIINWRLFSHCLGIGVGVRTSLSCPFNCRFCGFNQRAGKHQLANIETIEQELDMLESIGSIKTINFIDDTFNFPPQRFKEILKMMIRKDYSFKWNSYFRCQFADEEMVELMQDSGCEGVYLGIESASQKVLDNIRKGVTVDEYRRGVGLLKNSNVTIHMNFILGFVGETEETVEETISFIKSFEPDYYRFQLWYFDVVTPIWREREKFNVKGSSFMWSHDTMDSFKACDLIDGIITHDITSSVWLPVYNFNFHSLFQLVHRGLNMENIKGFLKGFSEGIKEGIRQPNKSDVGEKVILEIKENLS